MVRCLIALGSNEGPPEHSLRRAVQALDAEKGLRLVCCSAWHRTVSVGGPAGQPDFLNGAAVLETELSAEELLERLFGVEQQLGRVRRVRWGQRTLDLDLLLYSDQSLELSRVQVPHPRMSFRRFVLEPSAEVAGEMVHPTSGMTIGDLLAHLNSAPQYVALAAPLAERSGWLAAEIRNRLGCPILGEESATAALANSGDISSSAYQQAVHRTLEFSFWKKSPALVDRLSENGGTEHISAPPVVSPYWYPAVEAVSGARASPAEQIVGPALVIAWLAGARQSPEQTNSGPGASLSPGRLADLLKEAWRGPLLVIESPEPDEALHEATAAILAAWPGIAQPNNQPHPE